MQLTPAQNDLFLILFAAAAIHSLYLALLLFSKAGKEKGILWLGGLMVLLSFMVINYLFYIGGWIQQWPHLLGILSPFMILLGPCYYFFVVQSVNIKQRFHWYDGLHLIPFIYVLIEWLPLYFWSAQAKLEIIENSLSHYWPSIWQVLLGNSNLIITLIYLSFAHYHLTKHVSDYQQQRREWLLLFNKYFAFFLILNFSVQIIFWAFNWPGTIMELSLVLLLVIGIHLLGYAVLGKDEVLPAILQPTNQSKYINSPLSTSAIANYKEQVIKYLEEDKPWLQPDFSVDDLSKALDIPRHYISQILNEGLETSFYDLISQYRIREVQNRLLAGEAEQYSIMGVANNCGFRSKSSFNRVFKKITGYTPTNWLKGRKNHPLIDK